jgi:hypothetical protein
MRAKFGSHETKNVIKQGIDDNKSTQAIKGEYVEYLPVEPLFNII